MIKKIFLTLTGIIILAGGFVAFKLFSPAISNKDNVYLYIKEGETLSGLKEELKNRKLLKGSGFDLASSILRFKKPKPGRYLLKDGINAMKLVRTLRNGEQSPVRITIVKERTKEIFSGKFGPGKKFDLQFDSLQMIQYISNNDSLVKFGVDTNNVLSIIIPDTYHQYWNSSPAKMIQQFYSAYQKFWNPERTAKAAGQGLIPRQVMILASIVEEETNRKEDKFNIASVYINRLKKGMRLQADPTVKFVTRNFQLGRITGAHLKLESPYNTYLNAGLPPGPICTPSVESIDAVLDAPATDYLFFVASYTFDGSSIFTSNLTEHNKYARLFHAEQTRRADSIRKLKEKPITK